MRSGLFPRYPQGDLLCRGEPCSLASFGPFLVPALGVLVGAIGLWGFVEARHGRESARWATMLWLAAPMTLALQFSTPLAFGTGFVFLSLWFAQRGVALAAVGALLAGTVAVPALAVASLAVAAVLFQAGDRKAWWTAFVALGVGYFMRQGGLGTGGPFPSELVVGPGALEGLAVSRLHLLVSLPLIVLSAAALVSSTDWAFGLASLVLTALGALVGVPWLGRLLTGAPAWALTGGWTERLPMLRPGLVAMFASFQGLLLHFFIHKVPVL
jgi:hypothetical protein